MTRLPTPKANETSHITVRCNNREFLFHLNIYFAELVTWVNSLTIMYEIDIHHVIFMSNHIHLLLTPNHDNLGCGMSYFLTNLSKFLNFKLNRTDHIFGRRYRPTVVRDSRHFMNVIRYIYQNPLRQNMVEKVADYPYSSLGFYLGTRRTGIILKSDYYTQDLFNLGLKGWELWSELINHQLLEEDVELMRKSLEKRKFKFSREQIMQMQKNGTTLKI